jgi:methionyl-tRNA synthetase
MLAEAGGHLEACRFRAALSSAMGLAQEANRFLNETAPWKALPNDRAGAGRSLYTALCAINGLKIALSPYVPFSCDRLHAYLGYDTPLAEAGWQLQRLSPGQPLREPAPLFAKLEPSIAEQEEERLAS